MGKMTHPVYAIKVLNRKIREHEEVIETINSTIHGMELRGNNNVDHLKAERLKHKNAITDLQTAIDIIKQYASK
jgi:uncharacterized protein YdcH (DUF465 family)